MCCAPKDGIAMPDRLRSIVPMFGGATSYVDTLDAILEYVKVQEPTEDDLIGWHRGTFERVSGRSSIERRVRYLASVGFLTLEDGHWQLGIEGQRYMCEQSAGTLTEIMCRRNVGLRSLLYALLPAPMTIEAIGRQQLETHPELGWNPENTDMASQRANWLRSLGLVAKTDGRYSLTDAGREFVENAVVEWADTSTSSTGSEEIAAGTYETTVYARSVDPEFRATVLREYDGTCPVSCVDHEGLLDVAHVLSWSDYPNRRADLGNVLPLSKTHHAAFDRELFTIDAEYRLQVSPSFETESELLQRTIVERDGEQLAIPDGGVGAAYLREYNEGVEWFRE